MRKRKRKFGNKPNFTTSQAVGDGIHIRLCHVCLHLSESDRPIVQCQECQRYLTIEPLIEEHLESKDRNDVDEEQEGHGEITGGLNGLSVVW